MPTYEYVCKSCAEHLEVVQAFTDDSLTVCPVCGGTLRKVFGSIGISFKGSGFYRTDSRPAATKREKDQETAKERDKDKSAAGKDGASAKDGSSKEAASTTASSGSSSPTSETSSSKPASPSSTSGGTDKAKATTSTG